jgi:hypothetical protein
MIRLVQVCLILAIFAESHSQIVFSESFNVILDSSKVRGSIMPELRIRTQKKVLTEIDNLADLTIRLNNSRLTFANRVEFSRYGDELTLSGGYLYAELRNFTNRRIVPEYHGQIVYEHPRGLQIKYAAGINARLKIYTKKMLGIYFGLGPFYEYEKWDYSGVENSLLPTERNPLVNRYTKLASYISYKQTLFDLLNIDISGYHQGRFSEYFSSPRLASSIKVGLQITSHLEVLVMYQNIYV